MTGKLWNAPQDRRTSPRRTLDGDIKRLVEVAPRLKPDFVYTDMDQRTSSSG